MAVREQGKHVFVDLYDTALPQRLFRRLDVTDFATPVTAVESKPNGRNVVLDIQTAEDYDYLAYQTDDLFTLEFRALTPAEKEQNEKKKVVYTGDRLSLNFQDIEVRAVLQLLADFTGLNLVASDTVRGNITLRLKNVPWDQALDIILKTKGLAMRQTGNVIMVAPTPGVGGPGEAGTGVPKADRGTGPVALGVHSGQLRQGGRTADHAQVRGRATMLSERGNVTVDKRTNTLLVQDTDGEAGGYSAHRRAPRRPGAPGHDRVAHRDREQ